MHFFLMLHTSFLNKTQTLKHLNLSNSIQSVPFTILEEFEFGKLKNKFHTNIYFFGILGYAQLWFLQDQMQTRLSWNSINPRSLVRHQVLAMTGFGST